MKLYDADFAPSPRRVRVYLAEKGIEVPTEQVDLRQGQQLSSEFLAKNPTGTVPALELDDGTVINQIAAICQYFEETHPEPALMGTDARDKAIVTMWDRRMEGEGAAAVAEAFRNSHPAFKGRALPGPLNLDQIEELAERGKKRYDHFLKTLDERLGEASYVAGERYTVADITAMITLDFAQFVQLPGIEGYGNIERWYGEVSQRPSARA